MQQEVRALEVGEELVPEPDALARAFDQTWDVRHRQLARSVRRVDGAEHRRQRRERIVGDLRPRIRDAGQERGLARVRQPDERGVGKQLQAKLERRLLTREAGLGEARCPPRRRRELLVPAPRNPAAGGDDACGR